MESLQYRQYPKVVSLGYLYFFLPSPSFFFLLSVQTTLLIRHRVKEDGIFYRGPKSLLSLDTFFAFLLLLPSFFIFYKKKNRSYLFVEEKRENITRKC